MSVELVIAIPAFIVGLVVMVNVMMFTAECARFDRIAGEIARYSVVHHSDSQGALDRALSYPTQRFSAKVVHSDPGTPFVSHVRTTCTLVYKPWPNVGFSYGGLTVGEWSHAQSFVFDRFKPGAIF